MRLNPGSITKTGIALVMIDDHERMVSDQFAVVPAETIGIPTVKAETEKIISGLSNKFPHLVHVGLHLAATGQKTIKMGNRFLFINIMNKGLWEW